MDINTQYELALSTQYLGAQRTAPLPTSLAFRHRWVIESRPVRVIGVLVSS